MAGESAATKPWGDLLAAVRARGEGTRAELEGRAQADLELVARKDRKRLETEWSERIRRVRRRAETKTLDLGLQLVSLWLADLAHIALRAEDLVRNVDRVDRLRETGGRPLPALRTAVELVEETRRRFVLNVSEDLACEALAYRLEQALGA